METKKTPNKKPYKRNYFPIATDYKNIHFEWMFIRKRPTERFMVCLHFEKPDKNENLKNFRLFPFRKDELKKKYLMKLLFLKRLVIYGCKYTFKDK